MEEKKKTPKPKAGGVHAGHRQRMRARFMKTNLVGFQDHETLELLLYYAIPRRDVNETAHLLLQRFGSLNAVLDAKVEDLCTVPGVGPSTAQFLHMIPQVFDRVHQAQKHRPDPIPLQTPADVSNLLAEHLRAPLELGQTLLVLTDRNENVLDTFLYESFDKLSLRELVTHCAREGCAHCVLIEHVPDCTDFPLPGRIATLTSLMKELQLILCPLSDYYTVDGLGNKPRSYSRTGQLLFL